MYEAVFIHMVSGHVIESTIVVCGRKRWASDARAKDWPSLSVGRLVVALRLRRLGESPRDQNALIPSRLARRGVN